MELCLLCTLVASTARIYYGLHVTTNINEYNDGTFTVKRRRDASCDGFHNHALTSVISRLFLFNC